MTDRKSDRERDANMTDDVLIVREGVAGVITLNRPEVINALTLPMIEDMIAALEGWADDSDIRIVLIEGRGEKGLCAGGDVRAVRDLVLSGKIEEAENFFAREYHLNGLIATYKKPVVALQNGVVMGGGIGLSSHARYRICTETSRFAMPEALIGFTTDVGINALLARAPEHQALAFLLSGSVIGAADAIELGLSDTMVPQDQLEAVRARIIDAAHASDLDTAMVTVLQAEGVEPGKAEFCALAEQLSDCFEMESVAAIAEMLQVATEDGDVGAAALLARIETYSPTALAVILAAHRLARRQRSIAAVLKTDLALARYLCRHPDFAEGVRALLVDKDKKPKWTPSRHTAVDHGAIQAALSGL